MTRKYTFITREKFKLCKICGEKVKGLGFCNRHYQNFKRKGDPFPHKKNTLDLFLEYVENLKKEENGCKIWDKIKDKDGYGIICLNKKSRKCHRLLYETKFPGNYNNMVVRHSCDNPSCCNIDHLSIGFPKDNTMDMIMRGRNVIGSMVKTSKLKDYQVLEIREKCKTIRRSILAKQYNVSKSTIAFCITRKTFKHI